jgi:hypothetical protein
MLGTDRVIHVWGEVRHDRRLNPDWSVLGSSIPCLKFEPHEAFERKTW